MMFKRLVALVLCVMLFTVPLLAGGAEDVPAEPPVAGEPAPVEGGEEPVDEPDPAEEPAEEPDATEEPVEDGAGVPTEDPLGDIHTLALGYPMEIHNGREQYVVGDQIDLFVHIYSGFDSEVSWWDDSDWVVTPKFDKTLLERIPQPQNDYQPGRIVFRGLGDKEITTDITFEAFYKKAKKPSASATFSVKIIKTTNIVPLTNIELEGYSDGETISLPLGTNLQLKVSTTPESGYTDKVRMELNEKGPEGDSDYNYLGIDQDRYRINAHGESVPDHQLELHVFSEIDDTVSKTYNIELLPRIEEDDRVIVILPPPELENEQSIVYKSVERVFSGFTFEIGEKDGDWVDGKYVNYTPDPALTAQLEKLLVWDSHNPLVGKIKDGTLTIKGAGWCGISAYLPGYGMDCYGWNMQVVSPPPKTAGLFFSPAKLTITPEDWRSFTISRKPMSSTAWIELESLKIVWNDGTSQVEQSQDGESVSYEEIDSDGNPRSVECGFEGWDDEHRHAYITTSGLNAKQYIITFKTTEEDGEEHPHSYEVNVDFTADNMWIDSEPTYPPSLFVNGDPADKTAEAWVSFSPYNSTAQKVKWYSQNPKVATVVAQTDDNRADITAVGTGSTFIVAVSERGLTGYLPVAVYDANIPAVDFSITEGLPDTMFVGYRWIIASDEITFSPKGSYGEMTYSSTDTTVLDVQGNLLLAEAPGTVTLTASLDGEPTKDQTFTINVVTPVGRIELPEAQTTLRMKPKDVYNTPFTLTLYDYDDNEITANKPPIHWLSDNPGVATVSETGVITAVSAGAATIRAYTDNMWKWGDEVGRCQVTVYTPATGVKLNKKSLTMDFQSEYWGLTASALPAKSFDEITWSPIFNESEPEPDNLGAWMVKRDDGNIVLRTGKKAGKAKITATASSGKKAECIVTVKGTPTTVRFDQSGIMSAIPVPPGGQPLPTSLFVHLDGDQEEIITWSSSNSKVVRVAKGARWNQVDLTYPLSTSGEPTVGQATITAKTSSGGVAKFPVILYNAATKVKSVKLSVTSKLNIKLYEQTPIGVVFSPAGSYTTLIWSSDDEDIAWIDRETGMVHANGLGTTVIRGKCPALDVELKRTVTVTAPLRQFHFNQDLENDTWLTEVGQTLQIGLGWSNPNIEESDDVLTWKTSNAKVAKLSGTTGPNTIVTAVKPGTATITLTAKNSKKKVSFKVNVVEPVTSLRFDTKGLTVDRLGRVWVKHKKDFTIKPILDPAKSKDGVVEWHYPEGLVSKGKGKFTAARLGTYWVMGVTGYLGVEASFDNIVVFQPATKITLANEMKKNVITLKVGTADVLEPVFVGSKTDAIIKWTCSSSKVATVSADGIVTALSKGKTTITGTAAGGKKVTCTINVIP